LIRFSRSVPITNPPQNAATRAINHSNVFKENCGRCIVLATFKPLNPGFKFRKLLSDYLVSLAIYAWVFEGPLKPFNLFMAFGNLVPSVEFHCDRTDDRDGREGHQECSQAELKSSAHRATRSGQGQMEL
jgi:hypothetical protein